MTEKILQLNREKTIFWTLLGALLLGSVFYMYFINSAIHNVVIRQNSETEASKLVLQIGREEFQYITKRNAITLALAHSLGFEDVTNKTYVYKGKVNSVAFLSH